MTLSTLKDVIDMLYNALQLAATLELSFQSLPIDESTPVFLSRSTILVNICERNLLNSNKKHI